MMNPIHRIRTKVFKETQAGFAIIAGTTQATVSRWEDDKNNMSPSLTEMQAIRAEAAKRRLRWSDRWFFEREPEAA